MRFPRRRLALVALLGGLAALTACGPPSNEPDAYDDTTRANFIEGCTGIVTEGTALDASTSSVAAGYPLGRHRGAGRCVAPSA